MGKKKVPLDINMFLNTRRDLDTNTKAARPLRYKNIHGPVSNRFIRKISPDTPASGRRPGLIRAHVNLKSLHSRQTVYTRIKDTVFGIRASLLPAHIGSKFNEILEHKSFYELIYISTILLNRTDIPPIYDGDKAALEKIDDDIEKLRKLKKIISCIKKAEFSGAYTENEYLSNKILGDE